MAPPPPETRKEYILDVFQPGLKRGAERLPYSPHKRYFYVEHPEEGWRVYLRSACFLHELYKPFSAHEFLVVKRTGGDPAKATWEPPKGQMEGKDAEAAAPKQSIMNLLKDNIRREVAEEAKIHRIRELNHTGLVVQSVEPDFPPNTYFQYHIFSGYVHPTQLQKALDEFAWIEAHREEFMRQRSDKREKDAMRWFGGDETKLMGRWSPTIVKLYLKEFAAH